MPFKDKEERNAYHREWAKNNPEKRKKYINDWRKNNPAKVLLQRKRSVGAVNKRRRKEKDRVLEIYSGKIPPECNCCGEKIRQFLTLDHINGGGKKHREETNNYGIYRWIIKNKFPKGFQVLCMNCNLGKHLNKNICPHKTIQSTS